MKHVNIFAVLALSVSLFSCSSDEPTQDTQVGIRFNTMPAALTTQAFQKQTATGTLSFTSGHIAIGRLEFEVEAENDSLEIEFELEQNTIIDFATGTTTPDIGNITIPPGTYEEVEVEIDLNESTEGPAILLNGSYVATDGVEHKIRFEFDSEESFEVEREGQIVFAESQVAIYQVTFDPVLWFAEVTGDQFTNATKDAEGVIVVSATVNQEIFEIVADGLELASELEMEDENEEDEE